MHRECPIEGALGIARDAARSFDDSTAVVGDAHRRVRDPRVGEVRTWPADIDHVRSRRTLPGMGLCRNDGDGLTEPIGDVVRHDDAGSRLSRLDSRGRIALDPDDVTAADLDGLTFHRRADRAATTRGLSEARGRPPVRPRNPRRAACGARPPRGAPGPRAGSRWRPWRGAY